MISAAAQHRWSRRTFLLGTAAVAGTLSTAGLAGCSAPGGPTAPGAPGSPTAGAGPSATGGATPGPGQPSVSVFPGSVAGAALEDRLAAYATTLLSVGHDDLGRSGRRLVTSIRNQHLAHAAVLRSSDPTDPNSAGPGATTTAPSATPRPSAKAPSFAKAVDQLVAAESRGGPGPPPPARTAGGPPPQLGGGGGTAAPPRPRPSRRPGGRPGGRRRARGRRPPPRGAPDRRRHDRSAVGLVGHVGHAAALRPARRGSGR